MIPHREHQSNVKRRKYIRMIRAHAEVVKKLETVLTEEKHKYIVALSGFYTSVNDKTNNELFSE